MNKKLEVAYDEYLENAGTYTDDLHKAWMQISREIEHKLAAGSLTNAELAQYEEAVLHCGFSAGFSAAQRGYTSGNK